MQGDEADIYHNLAGHPATGALVTGPPWILGHRGTPREAPENTLSSLRQALEYGLDGFEYDLRACRTGEAVLMHDATLARTTDSTASLAGLTLPQLFGIDAGSWFGKRYVGEPVPLFDEALELLGPGGRQPMHMIEIKERGLIHEVHARLESAPPGLAYRIASFLRDEMIDARNLGHPTMLLADEATEDDRRFCLAERIQAHGVGPGGWRTAAGRGDWGAVERWSWSVDRPDDLLEACRTPLFGFNSNEPHRALAVRALCAWAPGDTGAYPVQVPELSVDPSALDAEVRSRGEWFGEWQPVVWVRNPFPFAVEVRCTVVFPSGAFELGGLPRILELEPGEERSVVFDLAGGSRLPGRDPLFAALFRWAGGGPRGAGELLLDAPLVRLRKVEADGLTRRLNLLRSGPKDPQHTLALRRVGSRVTVSLENTQGLVDPHVIVVADGHTIRGGRNAVFELPADFEQRPGGMPFTCGIEAGSAAHPVLVQWAGGLPGPAGGGSAGRLLPLRQA
ncbi:MAG: glycerophosphodiester phosphodiesterase family protein [Planctomycetota bacterium]